MRHHVHLLDANFVHLPFGAEIEVEESGEQVPAMSWKMLKQFVEEQSQVTILCGFITISDPFNITQSHLIYSKYKNNDQCSCNNMKDFIFFTQEIIHNLG